jgi:hypothetical protein
MDSPATLASALKTCALLVTTPLARASTFIATTDNANQEIAMTTATAQKHSIAPLQVFVAHATTMENTASTP